MLASCSKERKHSHERRQSEFDNYLEMIHKNVKKIATLCELTCSVPLFRMQRLLQQTTNQF